MIEVNEPIEWYGRTIAVDHPMISSCPLGMLGIPVRHRLPAVRGREL